MAHAPRLIASILGLTLAAAGCGGKQVEETPPPAPEVPVQTATPAPIAPPVTVDRPAAPDTRRETLQARIHFALDRADLSPEARTMLAAKAEVLRSSPSLAVRIDGHADDRGSDEYNLALSQRRAAEAKRFLLQQGIEAARLQTVGHGEEQPLESGASEAAWAMNRRADFQVTGGALSQR